MTQHRLFSFDNAPLRRLCFSLLLPFLLVLAQQGGLLHQLRHGAAVTGLDDRQDAAPDGKTCELCLAFAHVDASPMLQLHAAAWVVFGLARPTVGEPCGRTADAPPAHSRGPPRAA